MKIPPRYHRIDGWRGYPIPGTAIAGASDTGTWPDSPCPTPEVLAEFRRFRREVLKPAGITSRLRIGSSSNVFCAKRWLCVPAEDFSRAQDLAAVWLEANDRNIRFIHSA